MFPAVAGIKDKKAQRFVLHFLHSYDGSTVACVEKGGN